LARRVLKKAKKVRKILFGDGETRVLLDSEPNVQTGKWKYWLRKGSGTVIIFFIVIMFVSIFMGWMVGNVFGVLVSLLLICGIAIASIYGLGLSLGGSYTINLPANALVGNQAFEKSKRIFTYFCPNYTSDGKKLPAEKNPLSFLVRRNENLEEDVMVLSDHVSTLYANLRAMSRPSKESFEERLGELEKMTEAVFSKMRRRVDYGYPREPYPVERGDMTD